MRNAQQMTSKLSIAFLLVSSVMAQDTFIPQPLPETSIGTTPALPVAPVAGNAVSSQPPQQEAAAELEISPGEARIRAGIVLLGILHDTMARIQDRDSAEAAVPTILRLVREFQTWGQGFTALPPLDEETQSDYEKRYIPIINNLNANIQIQADRIAAAEFYGSEALPAALVRLINSVQ